MDNSHGVHIKNNGKSDETVWIHRHRLLSSDVYDGISAQTSVVR